MGEYNNDVTPLFISLDADLLAALALFFSPFLILQSKRYARLVLFLATLLIVSYSTFTVLYTVTYVNSPLRFILIGIITITFLIAILLVNELGIFIVGATVGALLANLIIHFVAIPVNTEYPHLFHIIALILSGLLAATILLYCLPLLLSLFISFVGAYLLIGSISYFLARLQITHDSPVDPASFFLASPYSLLHTPPSLLACIYVGFWIAIALLGVLYQQRNDDYYQKHPITNGNVYGYNHPDDDVEQERWSLLGRRDRSDRPVRRDYLSTMGAAPVQYDHRQNPEQP